jgi:hypothetical protein
MDDLVCLISIDAERLPVAAQLSALIKRHHSALPPLSRRIRLALLLPEVGVQITDLEASTHRERHLIAPPFFFEIFELLQRPKFTLYGEPPHHAQKPVWTAHAQNYLLNWRRQWHWKECHALYAETPPPLSNLDFLRRFWKSVQLTALARSFCRGEVVYPMTLPALERALEREGSPLPESLRPLAEAYRRELDGTAYDIQRHIPAALFYLHDMES